MKQQRENIDYTRSGRLKMASTLRAIGLLLFGLCAVTVAQGQQHAAAGLDTVQYPLYFSQKADSSLVASIGYTEGHHLRALPISSVGNALAGRMAGLTVFQQSGEPGNDGPNLLVRGQSPLILVDGVPRNMYGILPEHIESVTVLKDALSTAALGARGARGAILITTRKGAETNGNNLTFTANGGISQPLSLREQLRADEHATLYNEALQNEGLQPLYTPNDIQAYRNQTDPYRYPDNNWYQMVLREQAPYQRYIMSADGKSNAVDYFISADYLDQGGLLKQADQNTYSTDIAYRRFGFRGNMSIDVAPRTELALNLYGVKQQRNAPGAPASFGFAAFTNETSFSSGSVNNLFDDMIRVPANAYPIYNPNGTLGGNQVFSNNIWGQSTQSGYSETNMNEGLADLVISRDMGDVWEGWWLKGMAAYNMEIIHSLVRSKNFESFEMRINPFSGDSTYRQFGQMNEQSNSSNVNVRNGSFFVDGSTGWAGQWDAHQLDVALQYQFNSARYGGQLPFITQHGIARVNYQFQSKYLLDVVTSYGGNNWYKPGHRTGWYPAVGMGWNVHNEGFFRNVKTIDRLKLRASYGLVGFISANYHSYIYTFTNYGGAYHFGAGAGGVQGMQESQLPYVRTTEKARKLSAGADIGLFANRANVSIDYYRNHNFDLLQTRGGNTALLGAPYPEEHRGEIVYSGIETSAGWADRTGSFSYHINGNVAVQNSRIVANDQQNLQYPWMGSLGNRVGQFYGYIADGFVSSTGEGPVVEGYRSVPGDLKYRDLNNDGVINFYDRTLISPDIPEVHYAFNAGFSWNGFDFSALFAGVANRTINLTGLGEWEFQNNGNNAAYPHHVGRWTPETAETATYPRLSVGTNPNNHVNSTFWLESGDFLRLKTVELGYTFRGGLLANARIKSLRVFTSGFNLLTFSKHDRFDPEDLSRGYPLQRIVNAGVSIDF